MTQKTFAQNEFCSSSSRALFLSLSLFISLCLSVIRSWPAQLRLVHRLRRRLELVASAQLSAAFGQI